MNKNKLFASVIGLLVFVAGLSAKDYQVAMFGIKSDGVTLNTRSIQRAVDYISEQGGGRLIFYVGRYLTGSIELKSNVTICIEEGAVASLCGQAWKSNCKKGISKEMYPIMHQL